MTPVVFGVIEMALADYLGDVVDVPVINSVPRVRPASYVLVLRIGGAQSNPVTDRPRVVAECCAAGGIAAAELGAVVRARIGAIAPGYLADMWVDRTVDLGMVFSPDPDTNLPRYLITAELFVRGAVLP